MDWKQGLVSAAALLLIGGALHAQETEQLTVIAHDSFAYSEDVMAAFTEATGIAVEVLRLGDTGALVNQSILSRENPLGDVLFGVDNTFLSRALAADLFISYESANLETVDPAFLPEAAEHGAGLVTPITYGDVCLNYDAAYFAEHDLPLPETLADLTDPAYAGLLAVQNPATSSPGLAFLLTTIAVFGEDGDYTYLDFWRELVANDVAIAQDWTDAYYGLFSGSAGSIGTQPLVVSYASSPPAEVYFLPEMPDSVPSGAITAPGTCFRQIEYAGIVQNTDNEAAARQFIDFLLSREFQEDMPLNMFVFPVIMGAELPEVFVEYAVIPDEPVTVDSALIDANREMWIEAWTEVVLR